jgi:hypothetical protein
MKVLFSIYSAENYSSMLVVVRRELGGSFIIMMLVNMIIINIALSFTD